MPKLPIALVVAAGIAAVAVVSYFAPRATGSGPADTTILVRTVPQKMLFDIQLFAVEKGQPVAIVFQNDDMLPHNLVIARPGTLAKVGRAGETITGATTERERNFIPATGDVLWHTPLVKPGESARLTFVAPRDLGDYPFVCTFPGHWTVMNGVMQVVDEVDPARREVRRAPAKRAVAAREFVRIWKVADFEQVLTGDWPARTSVARGEQLFTVAGCRLCHPAAGHQTRIGPDLAGIGVKYSARTLLEQVLAPSATIAAGFATERIERRGGADDVIGRVVAETGTELQVMEDPNAPETLTKVPLTQVAGRTKLPISSMPTGLLITFQRSEVLDLLAYLASL